MAKTVAPVLNQLKNISVRSNTREHCDRCDGRHWWDKAAFRAFAWGVGSPHQFTHSRQSIDDVTAARRLAFIALKGLEPQNLKRRPQRQKPEIR